MAKGGYKIINLGGVNLVAGSARVVPGVYQAIESANGKPIVVQNFLVTGQEVNSMWINFRPVDNANFSGPASLSVAGTGISKITVTPSDGVYYEGLSNPPHSPEQSVTIGEDGPSASM